MRVSSSSVLGFTAAAIALGLVSGAAVRVNAQTVPTDTARAADMREHFSRAVRLHAAVIRGDMPAVASAAQALENYEGPPGMPARSGRFIAAIRNSAIDVSRAADIVAAAHSTALLLNACGDCHRSVGTMPATPLAIRPELGGVVGHMLAHQRAADQMLQGLIVPSNSLWQAGARAFVSAPLHPKDLPMHSAERRHLAPIEERIHRLATDAAQATDARARASFYGQMLAGCAGCHKQHAKLWGPQPQ
jgi:hypothetical protein